ncbi:MAG: DNA repair protein RecO [Oscillospiraceae bacterium]|nr:DNA repair protein RecO [Oscillospiraceae bacterium]
MATVTDGLIIREYNHIGESDRFVTVLTRDRGVIRASARGARKVKSRSAAATRLFSHSRLSLVSNPSRTGNGRQHFIIEDAQPLHTFFELHSDIEKLALAQYFCELAAAAAPKDADPHAAQESEQALRLMLNGLHFLSTGLRNRYLVKAAVELRLLSAAGYMPQLERCARCVTNSGGMALLPVQGELVCSRCRRQEEYELPELPPETLQWMRRVVYGNFEQIFKYILPDERCGTAADAAERYCLAQLGRGFHTLEFFKSML